MRTRTIVRLAASAAMLAWLPLRAAPAGAHCDTMDGPVVSEARQALERGDVAPVLKWIRSEDEPEIRDAFARARAARAQVGPSRDLADRWFFETLVRVHRAGEGEPYKGLVPTGAPIEPVIREADRAVERGTVDPLARMIAEAVDRGLRDRFQRVLEASRDKEKSVDAGRAFVAAYVDYLHYAERLMGVADAEEPAHPEPAEAGHSHEEKR